MNDQQLEQELSKLFSSPRAEEDFEALAAKVWTRNRHSNIWRNCAVLSAALLGGALSYFISGSVGFVPTLIANADIALPANGGQLIVAAGILVTLLSSFWIAKFASEQ
jgi:hypothetical protein